MVIHENGLNIFDEKFNLLATFFDENFILENCDKCFLKIMDVDVNELSKCVLIKLLIC